MITEAALARTFSTPGYTDPFDSVGDYRKALRYHSHHENKGSYAIARALNLPRPRVRAWMNGSVPDAVRAIGTADDLNWLDIAPTSPPGLSFVTLSAAIFSGGSITDATFVPRFADNRLGARLSIEFSLDVLGCGVRVVHGESDDRGAELEPESHASLLGRCLTTLGTPTGSKADQQLALPDFLDEAPDRARRRWVRVYLSNRAVRFRSKDTMRITESRNDGYLRDLATLIEDVAGERVTFTGKRVIVSAAAAKRLGFGKGDDGSLINH